MASQETLVKNYAGAALRVTPGAEAIELRQGLMLQLTCLDPDTRLTARFAIENSPVIFGFLLAGSNHCRYEEGPLSRKERILCSGSNGITYLPDTSGSVECMGGMHRLSILTSADFLEPYLEQKMKGLPNGFKSALLQKKDPLQWIGLNTPQKMRLVSDILATAFTNPLHKLFLESRALDLIGMELAEYLHGHSPGSSPVLNSADRRRIREVRDLLVNDLQNPPGIVDLARHAGMNEKKLKSGFKQMFGMPLFTYYRHHRLEVAHGLLASGQMNVTEAGIYIGFQSLGHFSQEFRKKYGVSPKDIQPRHRIRKNNSGS